MIVEEVNCTSAERDGLDEDMSNHNAITKCCIAVVLVVMIIRIAVEVSVGKKLKMVVQPAASADQRVRYYLTPWYFAY